MTLFDGLYLEQYYQKLCSATEKKFHAFASVYNKYTHMFNNFVIILNATLFLLAVLRPSKWELRSLRPLGALTCRPIFVKVVDQPRLKFHRGRGCSWAYNFSSLNTFRNVSKMVWYAIIKEKRL